MVNIKEKPRLNSQKTRKSKYTTMENHQFTKEDIKRGRKK